MNHAHDEVSKSKVKVFIAYADADKQWLKQLQSHLHLLERAGLIDRWDETCLKSGEELRKTKKRKLKEAQIVIFLLSADFHVGEFFESPEGRDLIRRAEEKCAALLPLIARTCNVGAPLDALALVNDAPDALDVVKNPDEILARVASRVRELAIEFVRRAPDSSSQAMSTPLQLFGESTFDSAPVTAVEALGPVAAQRTDSVQSPVHAGSERRRRTRTSDDSGAKRARTTSRPIRPTAPPADISPVSGEVYVAHIEIAGWDEKLSEPEAIYEFVQACAFLAARCGTGRLQNIRMTFRPSSVLLQHASGDLNPLLIAIGALSRLAGASIRLRAGIAYGWCERWLTPFASRDVIGPPVLAAARLASAGALGDSVAGKDALLLLAMPDLEDALRRNLGPALADSQMKTVSLFVRDKAQRAESALRLDSATVFQLPEAGEVVNSSSVMSGNTSFKTQNLDHAYVVSLGLDDAAAYCSGEAEAQKQFFWIMRGLSETAQAHLPGLLSLFRFDSQLFTVDDELYVGPTTDGFEIIIACGQGMEARAEDLKEWLVTVLFELEKRKLPVRVGVALGLIYRTTCRSDVILGRSRLLHGPAARNAQALVAFSEVTRGGQKQKEMSIRPSFNADALKQLLPGISSSEFKLCRSASVEATVVNEPLTVMANQMDGGELRKDDLGRSWWAAVKRLAFREVPEPKPSVLRRDQQNPLIQGLRTAQKEGSGHAFRECMLTFFAICSLTLSCLSEKEIAAIDRGVHASLIVFMGIVVATFSLLYAAAGEVTFSGFVSARLLPTLSRNHLPPERAESIERASIRLRGAAFESGRWRRLKSFYRILGPSCIYWLDCIWWGGDVVRQHAGELRVGHGQKNAPALRPSHWPDLLRKRDIDPQRLIAYAVLLLCVAGVISYTLVTLVLVRLFLGSLKVAPHIELIAFVTAIACILGVLWNIGFYARVARINAGVLFFRKMSLHVTAEGFARDARFRRVVTLAHTVCSVAAGIGLSAALRWFRADEVRWPWAVLVVLVALLVGYVIDLGCTPSPLRDRRPNEARLRAHLRNRLDRFDSATVAVTYAFGATLILWPIVIYFLDQRWSASIPALLIMGMVVGSSRMSHRPSDRLDERLLNWIVGLPGAATGTVAGSMLADSLHLYPAAAAVRILDMQRAILREFATEQEMFRARVASVEGDERVARGAWFVSDQNGVVCFTAGDLAKDLGWTGEGCPRDVGEIYFEEECSSIIGALAGHTKPDDMIAVQTPLWDARRGGRPREPLDRGAGPGAHRKTVRPDAAGIEARVYVRVLHIPEVGTGYMAVAIRAYQAASAFV